MERSVQTVDYYRYRSTGIYRSIKTTIQGQCQGKTVDAAQIDAIARIQMAIPGFVAKGNKPPGLTFLKTKPKTFTWKLS